MFARTVLAVLVLQKKSKKQLSKRGNKDMKTPVIPEIDTSEPLHQIENLNKSVDQPVKIDAFENNYHADTKMDSNVSGEKEPLLKNSLEKNSLGLTIDQNNKVDNEVCSGKIKNNKVKVFNIDESMNQTKTGDACNLASFTDPLYFDRLTEEPESKDMFPSELRNGDTVLYQSTSSPVDFNINYNIKRSHSLPSIQPYAPSTPQSLYHSHTFPLYKSAKYKKSNTTYNNDGLQITGTKIKVSTNDNEPVNKEIESVHRSKNCPPTEIFVDPCIAQGTSLIKVSAKKRQQRTFRIDVDQGRILWDSKKSGKVNIENIKELRIGEAIRNYRVHFKISSDVEDRWFTIIYVEAGKYKSLHLVADTADLFNMWVDNLERLYLHRRDMIGGLGHLRKRQSIWLKQHWKQASKDGGVLAFDELARLCRQLNINMSKQLLKLKFNEADEQKNGWLNFQDFKRFVKIIKNRQELDVLFESLSKTKENILTPQEFKDFLMNTQKFNLKEEDYDNIYYKFCPKGSDEMNLEGFNSFLMSSDNPIFASDHAKVYQDMDRPLNHYFIQSSHNTYLLGYQLTGESSVEGYARVLQRGCRCVEIDCWDGPDGPIVTHGRYTWTSKILFQDAINTIRTYAFKASPYPLILSLEVHCSIEQQNQMAQILVATLGDFLVTKFLTDNESELPSPESLMYRILLKGKNIPLEASEDSFDSATDTESATDSESDVELSKDHKIDKEKEKLLSKKKSESDVELSKDHTDKKKDKLLSKKKLGVAKALSDLVIYCSAVKFKGFEYHRDHSVFYHMSSFSERIATRLYKAEKHSFIRHNSQHLSRIYPTRFRINSSNFEPHHQWMVGNQLVALNWQKFDLGMQINQAMFAVNGRCGYVLKPERMHSVEPTTSTKSQTQILQIEIISAQQLPIPKDAIKGDDPFVEVELLVPGTDTVKKKTKTILDNGFNPIWNETLTFTIDFEYLELVFLRFVVLREDARSNEFIASYCIPVASLQQGYRHIPLNDASGDQYLFTTLFVRLSLVPTQN